METYMYELRKNRDTLERIKGKVMTITDRIRNTDMAFVFEFEPEKGENELFKRLRTYKRELYQLNSDLDIIYNSTVTKGRNYKFHKDPGLVFGMRGTIKKIKEKINPSIHFIDRFINGCSDLSIKSGKNTLLWRATKQQIEIVKQSKELESTMAVMQIKPGYKEIMNPASSDQINEAGNILTLIVVAATILKSFLDKKQV